MCNIFVLSFTHLSLVDGLRLSCVPPNIMIEQCHGQLCSYPSLVYHKIQWNSHPCPMDDAHSSMRHIFMQIKYGTCGCWQASNHIIDWMHLKLHTLTLNFLERIMISLDHLENKLSRAQFKCYLKKVVSNNVKILVWIR